MTKRVLLLACAVVLLGAWTGSASAQPNANHYVCHKVKDLKDPAKFVSNTTSAIDQVGNHNLSVTKPFLLCNPAIKNGNPIVDPGLHYVCYKAKGAKVAVAYSITDQFGALRLQTKKPFLLCNPALKYPA
jgi:hypothetical protein